MSEIFDVFISYRRSDGTKLARDLYSYLTGKGMRVFLDEVKLMNGTYFDTQLREKLISAPHYVLIGTTEAFKVRSEEDWVWKEIELAIDEYDRDPDGRTLTVLTAYDAVLPDTLPEKLDRILRVQRIPMPFGANPEIAFRDVLDVTAAVNKVNLWHAAHRWFENSKRPGSRSRGCISTNASRPFRTFPGLISSAWTLPALLPAANSRTSRRKSCGCTAR